MNSYDINLEKVPTHIAIIMDGNGRWAKSRFLPRTAGHKAGVEAIREVIKECQRLEVKHLTLYAFSTENWKRPKLEVDTLMTLLSTYLSKEIKELHKNNVKVTAIGDISKLPKNCIEQLNSAFELTKDNTGVNLNLALNYGSRDDIKNAIIDILNDAKCGKINIEEILSNFLMWEAAYSEFYFTDIHWPDFNRKELQKAIYVYQNRDRRFGGLSK